VAEGISAGILIASTELANVSDSPGLVLVASDGSLLAATEAGERWLDELADPVRERSAMPIPILSLAARLQGADAPEGGLPKLRLQTRAGRWAVLHTSRLEKSGTDAVAVIIEEPSPAELAPVILLAYGLTKQEQVLRALVCRGLSTSAIADRLHITPNTIQEHLKSIFEKTGVSSRRELVATILQEQYVPRVMAGNPIGPSGSFAS
jgi:DNA-binding CsgD family transcriptional regulator